jgi:hypothetical protein
MVAFQKSLYRQILAVVGRGRGRRERKKIWVFQKVWVFRFASVKSGIPGPSLFLREYSTFELGMKKIPGPSLFLREYSTFELGMKISDRRASRN